MRAGGRGGGGGGRGGGDGGKHGIEVAAASLIVRSLGGSGQKQPETAVQAEGPNFQHFPGHVRPLAEYLHSRDQKDREGGGERLGRSTLQPREGMAWFNQFAAMHGGGDKNVEKTQEGRHIAYTYHSPAGDVLVRNAADAGLPYPAEFIPKNAAQPAAATEPPKPNQTPPEAKQPPAAKAPEQPAQQPPAPQQPAADQR